ncbi:MAG: hypothetical protein IKM77_03165 [Prevotella sp.]|nr:hypothetical protein [Prevotella sp.]
MGLFDKLKDQALNSFNELQDRVNNVQNQQQSATPPPAPKPQMTPPPAPQPSQSGNSEGIYGNYMEHLIDMALADGELTEKEKQVLFKKAEANGIDLDEFEMVLDARLYERQKATQAIQSTTQGAAPKSEKYGDVRKCPGCGAIVESFTTHCPDCGLEFSNIGTVNSIQQLMQQLTDFDARSGGNEFINMFTGGTLRRYQKKCQIIANFPFPTAKNDILEFLSMAAPLAKKKGNFFSNSYSSSAASNQEHNALAPAWKAKCEQLVIKARLSMKDDKATLAEIEKYAQELKIK